MTANVIYIYGIVPNFYSTEMFRSLENRGLAAIPFENMSAIVSEKDLSEIDILNVESLARLLVHHQKTIEELQAIGFNIIIPIKLGTTVSSKEEVFKIFSNGYGFVSEILRKIQFLTEIDIAVTWGDFPAMVKEIAEHPDVVALKEAISKGADVPSRNDQMKAGILVQSKIKEKNSKIELNLLDILSSVSIDIKTHPVIDDQMVTNSAFLINRNNQEKFERIIETFDTEYGGKLNFRLIGPLPCYSFFTLEVKKLIFDRVIEAEKELGLKERSSEAEIKKAYLVKARLFHPDTNHESGSEADFTRITEAYHTLLDYSLAMKQSFKGENVPDEKGIGDLILVKIKD